MDLSWIDIVVPAGCSLIGALFGGGAIYWKENKKAKQIDNKAHEIENVLKLAEVQQKTIEGLQKQLNENHAFHQKQLEELEARYEKRFEETDKRTAFFKEKYEKMEIHMNIQDHAIAAAYRCNLPKDTDDCPVIKAIKESTQCEECRKRGSNECIECKE